jgi:hypothetical protein
VLNFFLTHCLKDKPLIRAKEEETSGGSGTEPSIRYLFDILRWLKRFDDVLVGYVAEISYLLEGLWSILLHNYLSVKE